MESTVSIKFFGAQRQVTLTIPMPACPAGKPACQWMLYVNEPDAPAQTVVGIAIGTSGTLTVNYPKDFCGTIQADALVGPPPWSFRVGHRKTLGSCTSPKAHDPTPAHLPFNGPTTTPATAKPPVVIAASLVKTTPRAQLPFTGIDVNALALVGTTLVLLGLLLLSTMERQRRALRHIGAAVHTTSVAGSHASRWFLGE